ncbi:MAG: hypothetical protein ACYCW6_31305 [Candidatus Xenobia bacterium]
MNSITVPSGRQAGVAAVLAVLLIGAAIYLGWKVDARSGLVLGGVSTLLCLAMGVQPIRWLLYPGELRVCYPFLDRRAEERLRNVTLDSRERTTGGNVTMKACVTFARYLRGEVEEALRENEPQLNGADDRTAYLQRKSMLASLGRWEEADAVLGAAREVKPFSVPLQEARSQGALALSEVDVAVHRQDLPRAWRCWESAVNVFRGDEKLEAYVKAVAAWLKALDGCAGESEEFARQAEALLANAGESRTTRHDIYEYLTKTWLKLGNGDRLAAHPALQVALPAS